MKALGVTGEYHKDLCHENGCLAPSQPTGDNTYGKGMKCKKGHQYYDRSEDIDCDECYLIKPHDYEASWKTKHPDNE
jgi:hypothetical protein